MPESTDNPIPRRALLKSLYQDQSFMEQRREVACGPGCFACCSDRVHLTTLEGQVLRELLQSLGREDLLRKAVSQAARPRHAPAYTCNQLARLCLEQSEPPAEAEAPQGREACFLLEGGRCAAYEARPMACRVMASRRVCAPGGQAEGDPYWLSLDTALLQIVEHLSLGGYYGALPQVLASLEEGGEQEGLLACEPLPGLVTPPEHRKDLERELGPVFATRVEGQPLGLWLDQIRFQG